MNIKTFEPIVSPPGRNSHNPLTILKLFQSTQLAHLFTSELQQISIQEFQLGNELLAFTPCSLTEQALGDQPHHSDSYLICDGRVRLLCQGFPAHRQIPATALEAGDVFGADELFCATPLPYQAIAASFCRIAQIPYQPLRALLERLPQLQEHLAQMAQQREYLIFFRRFTQLRSRPSSTLKQVLLPRLVKHKVPAGQSLAEAIPAETGHFWLRAGQIDSQSNPSTAPKIGESWGYPNPIPTDWVAQTDLMVYKLMLNPWETKGLLSLL